MAKRYNSGTWSEKKDKFNDEKRSDKSPMKSGPYHYDREERENYRQGERTAYRKMASAEHYAGMEPRRRQELEDMGMIHEDHREIANLPQNVMMKPYKS